jgi:hypothetical protein
MAATYVTQDDVDNYGPDLIDVAGRAAMTALAPHLQNLQHENADLRQRLASQAHNAMTAALYAKVPGWRETYAAPRFLHWFNSLDPYSGRPRSQLLSEAVQAGNAQRVIAFYLGFQQQERRGTGGSRRTSSATKPVYTREDWPVVRSAPARCLSGPRGRVGSQPYASALLPSPCSPQGGPPPPGSLDRGWP